MTATRLHSSTIAAPSRNARRFTSRLRAAAGRAPRRARRARSDPPRGRRACRRATSPTSVLALLGDRLDRRRLRRDHAHEPEHVPRASPCRRAGGGCSSWRRPRRPRVTTITSAPATTTHTSSSVLRRSPASSALGRARSASRITTAGARSANSGHAASARARSRRSIRGSDQRLARIFFWFADDRLLVGDDLIELLLVAGDLGLVGEDLIELLLVAGDLGLVGEDLVELLLVGRDLGLVGEDLVELLLVGADPRLVGEDRLLVRDDLRELVLVARDPLLVGQDLVLVREDPCAVVVAVRDRFEHVCHPFGAPARPVRIVEPAPRVVQAHRPQIVSPRTGGASACDLGAPSTATLVRGPTHLTAMLAALGVGLARAPAAAQPVPAPEASALFDERADKPFDRDTEVRLTGEQLAARGATDLASALALLPDVTVRDAGRGGFNVDIRGARKGAVSILVDGVLVTDPYYGTFDVSTIPITDIVQIRVVDDAAVADRWPRRPGRRDRGADARRDRRAGRDRPRARRHAADARDHRRRRASRSRSTSRCGCPAPGRSARAIWSCRGASRVGEGRHAAPGRGASSTARAAAGSWSTASSTTATYVAPPSDVGARHGLVDRSRDLGARDRRRPTRRSARSSSSGQYWVHYLHRRARTFADGSLQDELAAEDLSSIRSGGHPARDPSVREGVPLGRLGRGHPRQGARVRPRLAVGAWRDHPGQRRARRPVRHERVRVDAGVGLAMPFGVGATAWPEGKLVALYRARPHLEIVATTAYKGRVPSLRERFDPRLGNQQLGAEKVLHAELRIVEQRDRLRLEAAPFVRRTDGLIQPSALPAHMGRSINTGDLGVVGIDSRRPGPRPREGRARRRVQLRRGPRGRRRGADRSAPSPPRRRLDAGRAGRRLRRGRPRQLHRRGELRHAAP